MIRMRVTQTRTAMKIARKQDILAREQLVAEHGIFREGCPRPTRS
jgi:hypothetical protein